MSTALRLKDVWQSTYTNDGRLVLILNNDDEDAVVSVVSVHPKPTAYIEGHRSGDAVWQTVYGNPTTNESKAQRHSQSRPYQQRSTQTQRRSKQLRQLHSNHKSHQPGLSYACWIISNGSNVTSTRREYSNGIRKMKDWRAGERQPSQFSSGHVEGKSNVENNESKPKKSVTAEIKTCTLYSCTSKCRACATSVQSAAYALESCVVVSENLKQSGS